MLCFRLREDVLDGTFFKTRNRSSFVPGYTYSSGWVAVFSSSLALAPSESGKDLFSSSVAEMQWKSAQAECISQVFKSYYSGISFASS